MTALSERATITYESDEHTPLLAVLRDTARYEGVVDITVRNGSPTGYVVLAVDASAVTVQPFDDLLGAGVGDPVQIDLNSISALHIS